MSFTYEKVRGRVKRGCFVSAMKLPTLSTQAWPWWEGGGFVTRSVEGKLSKEYQSDYTTICVSGRDEG